MPTPIYDHLKQLRGYSQELQDCIETTVEKLLNLPKQVDDQITYAPQDAQSNNPGGDSDESSISVNPSTIIGSSNVASKPYRHPGLLLGKIQCGKTRAFVGVMGLMFDKGIDAVVVLTKSDDGLVNQTKSRMEYEFNYFLNPVSIIDPKISVYSAEKNLKIAKHQADNEKNIFICHKNTTRLEYMSGIISKYFQGKRILIIDDEADFVSRAYIKENQKTNLGKIALKISQLEDSASDSYYLQVTASPYSLLLQPDRSIVVANGLAKAFRPAFVTLVPIHPNYIGGKHYFEESTNNNSMYSRLFEPVDLDCINHLKKSFKVGRKKITLRKNVIDNAYSSDIYKDLRKALMNYLVGSAVRLIQENKKGNRYNSSFFMHISTEKDDHLVEYQIVENIMNKWKEYCKNNSWNAIQDLFDYSYTDMQKSNNKGNQSNEITLPFPSYSEVENKVKNILQNEEYNIQIVNSETADQNLLGKDGQLRLQNLLNIFIGGFRLDRGITIDNLIGFFYGRIPRKNQADTVLQHHRMYGNRSKEDMSVTRLYTTEHLYRVMKWIDSMDEMVREMFEKALPNQPEIPIIHKDSKGRVIPTNPTHLILSEIEDFKPFKRITPSGFQTKSATSIFPKNKKIEDIINKTLSLPVNQNIKDPRVFLISIGDIIQILKLIRETYEYSSSYNNIGLEWDVKVMITALENFTPADGYIYCYYVTGRDMSRVRTNGHFVDAPEDGNKDTPLAKDLADKRPVLMLLKEKGEVSKGWRGAEFFWPVLRLPNNISSQIYCKN